MTSNSYAGDTVALIDCENLTSAAQRAGARRWAGFARIELFGRAALVAPWRGLLNAQSETLVPDDAPSQAADQAMARRVDTLIALPSPPILVVIASNDKGFDADIARLDRAGIAGRRDRDFKQAEALRFLVAEAGGEWIGAGGIGDRLWRQFGLRLKGRVADLARVAGLEVRHTPAGLALRLPPAPNAPAPPDR